MQAFRTFTKIADTRGDFISGKVRVRLCPRTLRHTFGLLPKTLQVYKTEVPDTKAFTFMRFPEYGITHWMRGTKTTGSNCKGCFERGIYDFMNLFSTERHVRVIQHIWVKAK